MQSPCLTGVFSSVFLQEGGGGGKKKKGGGGIINKLGLELCQAQVWLEV